MRQAECFKYIGNLDLSPFSVCFLCGIDKIIDNATKVVGGACGYLQTLKCENVFVRGYLQFITIWVIFLVIIPISYDNIVLIVQLYATKTLTKSDRARNMSSKTCCTKVNN